MPRKPKHQTEKDLETLSYADLPPPSVEEREELISRITALYDQVNEAADREKRDWYLSMVEWAP